MIAGNDWLEQLSVEASEAAEVFLQVPSLLGRQFLHDFLAFTQAQPLHEPDLLHLQHAMKLYIQSSVNSNPAAIPDSADETNILFGKLIHTGLLTVAIATGSNTAKNSSALVTFFFFT